LENSQGTSTTEQLFSDQGNRLCRLPWGDNFQIWLSMN
jgi:hypothetical protein